MEKARLENRMATNTTGHFKTERQQEVKAGTAERETGTEHGGRTPKDNDGLAWVGNMNGIWVCEMRVMNREIIHV